MSQDAHNTFLCTRKYFKSSKRIRYWFTFTRLCKFKRICEEQLREAENILPQNISPQNISPPRLQVAVEEKLVHLLLRDGHHHHHHHHQHHQQHHHHHHILFFPRTVSANYICFCNRRRKLSKPI